MIKLLINGSFNLFFDIGEIQDHTLVVSLPLKANIHVPAFPQQTAIAVQIGEIHGSHPVYEQLHYFILTI